MARVKHVAQWDYSASQQRWESAWQTDKMPPEEEAQKYGSACRPSQKAIVSPMLINRRSQWFACNRTLLGVMSLQLSPLKGKRSCYCKEMSAAVFWECLKVFVRNAPSYVWFVELSNGLSGIFNLTIFLDLERFLQNFRLVFGSAFRFIFLFYSLWFSVDKACGILVAKSLE